MLRPRVAIAVLLFAASGCKRETQPLPDASAPPEAEASGTERDATAEASERDPPPYRTAKGGFQVRFPEGKAPEVEEKRVTGAGPPMLLFKVRYGSSAYIVGVDDFSKSSGRSAEETLEGARAGFVESTGGTIDGERPLSLRGHPGFELSVSATTSGITMRQKLRAYFVGGRLYQTIVVAPEWSAATALEQAFFDSFELFDDAD